MCNSADFVTLSRILTVEKRIEVEPHQFCACCCGIRIPFQQPSKLRAKICSSEFESDIRRCRSSVTQGLWYIPFIELLDELPRARGFVAILYLRC
jgi:hypothetical protein